MKTQFFLCLFVAQNFLGSYHVDNRIDNSSPTTIQLYNQYKQSFSAFFCMKALEQNKNDIASRCGLYGLGIDWRSRFQNVSFPFHSESLITVGQGEVLDRVATDMVNALPDIAEWLKQNAKS